MELLSFYRKAVSRSFVEQLLESMQHTLACVSLVDMKARHMLSVVWAQSTSTSRCSLLLLSTVTARAPPSGCFSSRINGDSEKKITCEIEWNKNCVDRSNPKILNKKLAISQLLSRILPRLRLNERMIYNAVNSKNKVYYHYEGDY